MSNFLLNLFAEESGLGAFCMKFEARVKNIFCRKLARSTKGRAAVTLVHNKTSEAMTCGYDVSKYMNIERYSFT